MTLCLFAVCFLLIQVVMVSGCTDFGIKAVDESYISARSMEFAEELNSDVTFFPRGERFSSNNPDGGAGISWISKYNYVGINGFGIQTTLDGLNEKGLSLGLLWMPGADYQKSDAANFDKTLDYVLLGDWILGNFSTVDEVREALRHVIIWGYSLPQLGMVAPFHLALHDDRGNSLVVEFVQGDVKIHANPTSILTNFPTFDWHLINLRNYVNLSPDNTKGFSGKGLVLEPTGQGSGMLGIPGDWTPPSRFVRTAALLQSLTPVKNSREAVNVALHLLNSVDIPKGDIREGEETTFGDYTQWAVVKDLTNRVLYFRTYEDMSLKSLDLKNLEGQTKGFFKMKATDSLRVLDAFAFLGTEKRNGS